MNHLAPEIGPVPEAYTAGPVADGILSGIRIIDLSQGLAGPVATMLLAEAGADVIKVEPPGGDAMRALPAFATWNRSKRSAILDLSQEAGRGDLEALLGGADVLVHSLLPEMAARRGLDDAALGARFPSLIVSGVFGYPPRHPDVDRPGWDILVQARSGLMDEQQGFRDGPVFLRFPVPSWGAAYLAASAVLLRLVARKGGGGAGGPAHTSLLQGALVTLTMHWARARTPTDMFAFGLPKGSIPSLYRCADDVWIHIMGRATEHPLLKQTLRDLGHERFDTQVPGDHRYLGDGSALRLALRQRPSREWLDAFWAADVAVLPAQPVGEILRDDQARANGYLVEVEDAVWGPTTQAGCPFTTTPPSEVPGPAPRLGEHTNEVLAGARAEPGRAPGRASIPGTAPLAGLRVLDFGNFLAGPFAAMLLADAGADVVKVEAIGGDQMRPVERVFSGCQRGKRGVCIDLKNPAARPVVEALVRGTDVIHHNLRYDAARRLGIDYETLRPLKPDLVYCHTSAYGPRGERAGWPGFDQLFQAYAGWELAGGGEGNPPMWHRMGMMDHQNALASLVATLLALYHRERTGEGQFVTASILGASVLTASETLLLADGSAPPVAGLDHDQTGLAPGYRLYRLEDGWLAVAALTDQARAALRLVAGASDDGALAGALAGRKLADATARLQEAGVPAEAARLDQMDTFFDDPANQAAGLIARYPHEVYGDLEQIGGLWDLGDLPLALDRPPPRLGEHTVEVLAEAGLTDAEIENLLATGVIAGPRD